MTAILNPIDTGKQMWGAVEAAWERDVVNGDARSRVEFFSYRVVSVIGVKGLDKLGKAGKLGNAASKADNTLPYNAMKTDKLKETLKSNVYSTVQQKTRQAADFWKSNFSKEAINKTIEAAKNSAVITKAKKVLDPANIKAAAAKTYEGVVKTPIAKTQAALKAKKEQLLDMPFPNFGLASVPLGPTMNMTVREGIEAAKDTVVQIVGKREGGGERTEGRGNVKHLDNVPRIKEVKVNFKRNDKHDSEEFARQLKDQEKGMNELTVDEYLKNHEKYIEQGRTIEGNAAQQAAREEAYVQKVTELQREGLTLSKAKKQAKEWLDTQAALHNPDQIAVERQK